MSPTNAVRARPTTPAIVRQCPIAWIALALTVRLARPAKVLASTRISALGRDMVEAR
nr:hypothetical protein [Propionibacterium acidifaciens]